MCRALCSWRNGGYRKAIQRFANYDFPTRSTAGAQKLVDAVGNQSDNNPGCIRPGLGRQQLGSTLSLLVSRPKRPSTACNVGLARHQRRAPPCTRRFVSREVAARRLAEADPYYVMAPWACERGVSGCGGFVLCHKGDWPAWRLAVIGRPLPMPCHSAISRCSWLGAQHGSPRILHTHPSNNLGPQRHF